MDIYRNTVSDLLWESLLRLMDIDELKPFRLVGGTSLSLMLGHRKSEDIDLFTDAEYNTIDFEIIYEKLVHLFPYVQKGYGGNKGFGNSYFIGKNNDDLVKLDLYYTDPFIRPIVYHDSLRLSSLEDVIAMKLEVVGNTGRKKDFWDLHELLEHYPLSQMLEFYLERNPYNYTKVHLLSKLTDFSEAEFDFDPICLKSKYWELIRLDIEEAVKNL